MRKTRQVQMMIADNIITRKFRPILNIKISKAIFSLLNFFVGLQTKKLGEITNIKLYRLIYVLMLSVYVLYNFYPLEVVNI